MEERKTGLYAAVIVVLVLLLGCAVFFLWLLFYPQDKDSKPPQQEQELAEEQQKPELPKTPDKEAYKPPEPLPEDEKEIDPKLEEHLYGTLRLSYDKETVTSETEDPKTRVTLLDKKGDELPRLDAQVLNGSGLEESERVRLAVGLAQAYYTDPPASETVNVSPDPELESGYVLEIPAVGETQAMTARVRFLPTGAKLWYLTLLYPSGTTPGEGLVTAYEGAAIA